MTKDNVISILEKLKYRNAESIVSFALNEPFINFLIDQSEFRFKTIEEQRACVIGGAIAIGYYGKEIKKGTEDGA